MDCFTTRGLVDSCRPLQKTNVRQATHAEKLPAHVRLLSGKLERDRWALVAHAPNVPGRSSPESPSRRYRLGHARRDRGFCCPERTPPLVWRSRSFVGPPFVFSGRRSTLS